MLVTIADAATTGRVCEVEEVLDAMFKSTLKATDAVTNYLTHWVHCLPILCTSMSRAGSDVV